MATTTISWGDGSGDNIYLTYPSASGDQTVSVSSDANTGAARSKVVSFNSGVGSIVRQLTVEQEAGAIPVDASVSLHPVSYDQDDYLVNSVSNIENAYADSNSSSYAQINCTKGSQAVTHVAFLFDVSSIPANATIKSVSLKYKALCNGTSGNMPTRGIEMLKDTTRSGSAATLSGTASEKTLSIGSSWDRAELNTAKLRVYTKRGTSNVNTDIYVRFYGATLTVNYSYLP